MAVATEERQQRLYPCGNGAGKSGEERKKEQNFENVHALLGVSIFASTNAND
jgi:hypothetical protein